MSNLIGFFFDSAIGIAVLAIFCRMLFNLYKYRGEERFELPNVSSGIAMPKCNTPKTDFNEMCENCFGSMISKMPLRTICDLKEVERQRMIGCSHNSRADPQPPTTEYLRGNEPDFGVKAPNLTYPKTDVMPCGHYNIGCTEYMCNDG